MLQRWQGEVSDYVIINKIGGGVYGEMSSLMVMGYKGGLNVIQNHQYHWLPQEPVHHDQ